MLDNLFNILLLYIGSKFRPKSSHQPKLFSTDIRRPKSASYIMAPSGTGFSANIAYSNPNTTTFIELFTIPIHTRTGFVVKEIIKSQHYYALAPFYNCSKKLDCHCNLTHVCSLLIQTIRLDINHKAINCDLY